MKLFHKSKKPELNDEALDRLLADAYDARLSGLSENECRDKHCLFEPLDNEASAPETHPTSAKAFPLRGRCPGAYTGADEVAPDTQPIPTAEPRPIRAVPARSLRWRTAAAAALFLVFLGAGGWLLAQSLRVGFEPFSSQPNNATDSPMHPNQGQLRVVPQNCHAEKDGKVTVWVLDNPEIEYDGEYDLQKASKDNSFFHWVLDAGLDYWLPEGFAQKTVMSYEEYAAYCESFDLEQKYDDPNMCYAIYAWAFTTLGVQAPCLADVVQSGDAVHVFLHTPGEDGINSWRTIEAWVLVLPVSADTETLEVFGVLSETEYQYRKLSNQTVMENNTEGKLCITGIANTLFNFELFPEEKKYVAFWLQYEGTVIRIIADDKTECVNPDGTPFKKEDYEAFTNTPHGQARTRICVVAENCHYVSEAHGPFDNYYHAERIVFYTGEEADRILREAQLRQTQTNESVEKSN